MSRPLEQYAAPFQQLRPDTPPRWGEMSAQMMVEHVIDTLFIASGRVELPLVTPEERLPAYRAFLMDEAPFERNIQNPLVKKRPLKAPSLEAALDRLLQEIQRVYAYFEEHPDARPVHPIFGPLNLAEWEQFHRKHMTHHAVQFGLLPDPLEAAAD